VSARRGNTVADILALVAQWAGGEDAALVWFEQEPIPAFDGRTAAQVFNGDADAVFDYVEHLTTGGYA